LLGIDGDMALIQCPECSGQVSDQALACPHCGYPLKSTQTAATEVSVEERFRQIHGEKGPIQAIKYLREQTGKSLGEAKAYYDREKAAGRLVAPIAGTGGASKSGCLTVMVAAILAGIANIPALRG
jgi:hypothetical protein